MSKVKFQIDQTDGPAQTRAWVIHPQIKSDINRRDAHMRLDEALSLAQALPGLEVVGGEIIALPKVRAGYLLGSGKVSELAAHISEQEIELLLVDGPLTPVQQRNLEKALDVKILDRTGLILEIFSDRAATREGVLQVEMASLSYQRTRLVRAWTHLERQRGGLGFVGGPGETQIEADRRAIDAQLVRLRRQLGKVVKTRSLHRAARAKVPYPIVALVGYTNAGKSTLFNRLTGAEVMARDMLFATLDPTMRQLVLPGGAEVILSDTVGFISDLPTELIAAFKATLEEVLSADLIVHVRDISHPESDQQAADVHAIMAGLNVPGDCPVLEVWNKLDLLPPGEADAMRTRARSISDIVPISAARGDGVEDLITRLHDMLSILSFNEQLHLSYAQGRQRAWLFSQGIVHHEEQDETGFSLHVCWSQAQKNTFSAL